MWNIWRQLDPSSVGATRGYQSRFCRVRVRPLHSSSVMKCHIGSREREAYQLGSKWSHCISPSWWENRPKEIKWLILGHKASLEQRQNLSSFLTPSSTSMPAERDQTRKIRKKKKKKTPQHTCLWERPCVPWTLRAGDHPAVRNGSGAMRWPVIRIGQSGPPSWVKGLRQGRCLGLAVLATQTLKGSAGIHEFISLDLLEILCWIFLT